MMILLKLLRMLPNQSTILRSLVAKGEPTLDSSIPQLSQNPSIPWPPPPPTPWQQTTHWPSIRTCSQCAQNRNQPLELLLIPTPQAAANNSSPAVLINPAPRSIEVPRPAQQGYADKKRENKSLISIYFQATPSVVASIGGMSVSQ